MLKNKRSIEGFAELFDILFDYDFSAVEGFSEFKEKVLNLGKTNMYKTYWNQGNNLHLYSDSMGL